MALTGLQIFKLLPKKNCRECGFPTCLAFAMQLAQKKVELSKCPYVSEEAKRILEAESAPPQRLITIGTGEKAVKIGEEQVMFRHDDKFYHETAIAVRVFDDVDTEEFKQRLEKIKKLSWERIGFQIGVNLVAVECRSGDGSRFAECAKSAHQATGLPLVLIGGADELKAAAEAVKETNPLLCSANTDNWQQIAEIAKSCKCPLVVEAESPDALAELTEKIKGAGVEDMVLRVQTNGDILKQLEMQTIIRRAALKKTFRPLGYPTLAFAFDDDPYQEATIASILVCKYAGVVVTDLAEPHFVLPILVARQNIYTNPQKPIAVEQKLYPVGEPDDKSPLMFTTNFSLTYFSVQSEVEASRVPSWILAVDTEGLSVLTAYSGDKLNAKVVADALKKTEAEKVVSHRKIIIPGLVAVMSGELEEETGWQVVVGPKEAAYLPKFLKETWTPD